MSFGKRLARISPSTLRGRAGVAVRTPFDEVFVGQLKAMIPRNDRWFNPHVKTWWVAEDHVDLVTYLVRDCFGTVEITGTDGRKITLTPAGETLVQEELPL